MISTFNGLVWEGAVDHGLGMLAATEGDIAADQHFRDAAVCHQHRNAPLHDIPHAGDIDQSPADFHSEVDTRRLDVARVGPARSPGGHHKR